MTSPESLFAAVLAARPTQPLVTFYDEARGERSELSARSLGNWVAKTHFLLGDELGLGVGDAAFVDLPEHWISVPALLGCWTAGLEVVTDPARATVAFVQPSSSSRAKGVPDVFAVAPDSAAVGFADAPPDGTRDYVTAVRPQPDAWASVHSPAGDSDPALDGQSRSAVAAWAATRAAELGLDEGARLLTSRNWTGGPDWVDTLLAPLAVIGSIVIVRNAAAADIDRRAQQERVTNVLDRDPTRSLSPLDPLVGRSCGRNEV